MAIVIDKVLTLLVSRIASEATDKLFKSGGDKNKADLVGEIKALKDAFDAEKNRPLEVSLKFQPELKEIAEDMSGKMKEELHRTFDTFTSAVERTVSREIRHTISALSEHLNRIIVPLTSLLASVEQKLAAAEEAKQTVQKLGSLFTTLKIFIRLLTVCSFLLTFFYIYKRTDSAASDSSGSMWISYGRCRQLITLTVMVMACLSPLWIFDLKFNFVKMMIPE